MKKLLLIVVGGLVVLGAIWVGRNGDGESPAGAQAEALADGKDQQPRVEAPSIQRMKPVAPEIDPTLDYSEEELSEPVMELLGLDERNSTIAGTSLIGLELLSRTHEEFDRESIVDSALEIASDESASAASRMTALRMATGVAPTPKARGSSTDNADYMRMNSNKRSKT